MKYFLCFLSFLFLYGCSEVKSRMETFTLHSEVFQNDRTIRVYLPKGYNGKKEFKVLYLNDGQDLFGDGAEGSRGSWRIREIADSLIGQGLMEPLTIVGMDNAGKERGNEYLPWEDIYLTPPVPNPHGNVYPDFITEEVIPAIEKRYKVKEGKESRGIGGFSYGGLISVYTIIKKPEWFGFALIESPSLYVNEQKVLSLANESDIKWPSRISIGIGTNEMAVDNCDEENEDNKMAVNDVLTLKNIIENQSPGSKVNCIIDKCAVHHVAAVAKRLPKALEFLLN